MKKGTIWAIALVTVCLRGLDFFLTWRITPDLRRELNPLHTIGEVGWAGLVVANVVVVSLVLSLFVYACRTQTRYFPSESALERREFLSHFMFDGRRPAWHALWRFPPGLPRNLMFLGFGACYAVILGSAVITGSSYAAMVSEPWRGVHNAWIVGWSQAAVWLIGILVAVAIFLEESFRAYRRALPIVP